MSHNLLITEKVLTFSFMEFFDQSHKKKMQKLPIGRKKISQNLLIERKNLKQTFFVCQKEVTEFVDPSPEI